MKHFGKIDVGIDVDVFVYDDTIMGDEHKKLFLQETRAGEKHFSVIHGFYVEVEGIATTEQYMDIIVPKIKGLKTK